MPEPVKEDDIPYLIKQIRHFNKEHNFLNVTQDNSTHELNQMPQQDSRADQLVTYSGHIFKTAVPKKMNFLCSIPHLNETLLEPPKSETELTEEDKQKLIGKALLAIEEMGSNCMIYSTTFWKYEYCPKKYVRQFYSLPPKNVNSESPPLSMEYYLGKFSGIVDASPNKDGDLNGVSKSTNENPDQLTDTQKMYELQPNIRYQLEKTSLRRINRKMYISQLWSDGTTCEVTEKPRSIEVRYQCGRSNSDIIYQVSEVSTCKYLIVIHSKNLCKHESFFDPLSSTDLPIKCWSILNETAYDEYHSMKALGKNSSITQLLESKTKDPSNDKKTKTSDSEVEKKQQDLVDKLLSSGGKKLKIIKLNKDGKLEVAGYDGSDSILLPTKNTKRGLGLKPKGAESPDDKNAGKINTLTDKIINIIKINENQLKGDSSSSDSDENEIQNLVNAMLKELGLSMEELNKANIDQKETVSGDTLDENPDKNKGTEKGSDPLDELLDSVLKYQKAVNKELIKGISDDKDTKENKENKKDEL
ncbi:Protein OS-9-like protein [Smittium mucronatum]|uniref:Protein OS-9 homolog n=1 Tax=Smittium mucronatum TaxID=133383 RepID=A0A1R0GTX3_9FUNG|nr:Protein OS-9-like protein [Smittium mucronatum]